MICFSFVGVNDSITKDSSGGALLTICRHYAEELSKIYIFANSNSQKADFLQIAEKNSRLIKNENPQIQISIISSDIIDPTNHKLVYQILNDEISKIFENDNSIKKSKKIINISSGTPTMATCWTILSKSGLVPNSTLIQSVDPKFRRQVINNQVVTKDPIQEVELELDNFPELKSPEKIKRELNRTKVELDAVKESKAIIDLDSDFPDMIGESSAMRKLKGTIINCSKSDLNVLILGKTGVGKELVAKHLVSKGLRADKPFRVVNFGYKSEQIIESELFGHKKGSFTGADSDKEGLFKVLDGGTLFLDEVGELPIAIQTKLLRVIEYGDFTPLGSTINEKCNVTVIAATNADLAEKITKAEMREDFILRFQIRIDVPCLTDRKEDIPLLINHIISKNDLGLRLSPNCIKYLKDKDWPGNIRELVSVLRSSNTVDKNHPLEKEDLIELAPLINNNNNINGPFINLPLDQNTNIDEVLSNIEHDAYERALIRHNGNAEKAAKDDLHIAPPTLRKRLRKNKL